MNFAILNKRESALVEARQTDYLLSQLNSAQGGKNTYREDAFGRFLTGMLYQEAGDIDNANVSYLLALEAYQKNQGNYGVNIPRPLLMAAMENARAHSSQAVQRVSRYGTVKPRKLPAGAGEVILLYQAGLIPRKVEDRIVIAWKDGYPYLNRMSTDQEDADTQRTIDNAATIFADDSLTVSFPKYVRHRYSVRDLSIAAQAALSISDSSLVADIGKIAQTDLADHKLRIQAKTIARAAFFYASLKLLENKLRDEGKPTIYIEIAKATEKIRQIVFEKADIRQWDNLPDQIKLISIVLPAGEHTLKLGRIGLSQPASEPPLPDLRVTVTAGKRTFASVRTVL